MDAFDRQPESRNRRRTRFLFRVAAWALITAACAAGCAAAQSYIAPRFKDAGVHKGAMSMTEARCFECHYAGKDGAPAAPRSMYTRKNCWRCHLEAN